MDFQERRSDLFQNMDQQPLPNATAVLVLGIISIAGCFCYGLPGLACGIIALILAGKGRALYMANPDAYTEASYKNLNGGRICAMIGVILSCLYFVLLIAIISIVGFKGLTDPNAWQSVYSV